MSGLATIRHTVRRGATRTRRNLLWTPRRFRTAITVAVAVLVLVPVVSLVVRQPWQLTAGGTGGTGGTNDLGDQGRPAGTVGNALAGPAPSGTVGDGLGGPPASGATEAAPSPVDATGTARVDAGALPLGTVLAAGEGAAGSGGRGSGDGPALSPDGANDVWKAQARLSAARFTQAWLAGASASSVDAWLRGLDPWLDPGSRQLVALTNLGAIPRTSASSVQLLTLEESDATAVVALADRSRLDVTLVWDGDRWRVTSYEPVAASVAAPPGPRTTAGPTTSPTASGTAGTP